MKVEQVEASQAGERKAQAQAQVRERERECRRQQHEQGQLQKRTQVELARVREGRARWYRYNRRQQLHCGRTVAA